MNRSPNRHVCFMCVPLRASTAEVGLINHVGKMSHYRTGGLLLHPP